MSRPLYINDFAFHCILGGDKTSVLEKLKNGERGDFTVYDVAGVMRPAATIDPETLPAVDSPKYDNRVNRLSQAALSQMDSSIHKAIEKFGPDRIGIFIGSCDNGSETSLNALRTFRETGAYPEGYVLDYQAADFPARFIAERYGITGMLSVHSTACASSASAFVSARNNIYAGNCDAAIVGGVDIASRSVILGFPVHDQHPEFTQTHVHRVSDAIQPSHPLSSPSPPALNPSQHQTLFQPSGGNHVVRKKKMK